MSLAENRITRPQDLVGATVAIDLQATTGFSFLAMLAAQGIALEDVNIVPRTGAGNDQLTSGEVDVLDAYINNQPISLEHSGYDINTILASDYGIDIYSNVIFTTEEMIANQPDVVEKFLRATVRGMQRAVNEPTQAAQYVLDTYLEDKSAESAAINENQMQAALPLMNPADSNPGMMRAEVWEFTHETLLDQGILSEPLDDLDAAYTLDFLNNIYSE